MKLMYIFNHLVFIGLIFMLCSGIVIAQRPDKQKTFDINIALRDSIVKAEAIYNSEKIKPHQERFYYWFKTNRIYVTQGSFDGKLLHGKFSCFYADGNLKSKGEFKNGMKQNEWLSWDKQGIVESVTTWKKGIKQGPYKEYDPTGNLSVKAHYSKNKLHGKYFRYDVDQSTIVMRYKHGELDMYDKKGDNIFKKSGRKFKGLFKGKDDKSVPGEKEKLSEPNKDPVIKS